MERLASHRERERGSEREGSIVWPSSSVLSMGCFAAGMYAKRPAERTGASSRILLKRIGREREREKEKKKGKKGASCTQREIRHCSVRVSCSWEEEEDGRGRESLTRYLKHLAK